jgi:hypothetical protein
VEDQDIDMLAQKWEPVATDEQVSTVPNVRGALHLNRYAVANDEIDSIFIHDRKKDAVPSIQ